MSKDTYLEKIITLLRSCSDMELLDLVLTLLRKSCNGL